jgi:capsular exopolysaccharide synthesis family protein
MLSNPKRRMQRREEKTGDLSGRLVTLLDPDGVASEAYRSLRTSLLYTLVDAPPKVITVTSPGPREGKTTTCANLGVVLAQAGKNTLIVDCDLRKPEMQKIFGFRNLNGITNALADQPLSEVWQESPVPGLKIVTSGPIPPHPAELLSSKRFSDLVNQMRLSFDYVLMDAPPVMAVSDPAILAVQGDAVLLVLDAQNTHEGSVRRSVRTLWSVGANVLGTVMNNF